MEISYHFEFDNGKEQSFRVEIDENTMLAVDDAESSPADWTLLEHKKCSHCPLNASEFPQCPIAKNLNHLVEHFKDTKSFWTAKVRVVTAQREYLKETDLQSGMFSIFGLIMATSQCPHMTFLRPMARFHLPFATLEETIVRSTSMFLLKQYIISKDDGSAEVSLKDLEKNYESINAVNHGIIDRIRSLGKGDTQSNAVIILDSFAQLLSMEIASDLSSVKPYFT